MDKAEEICRLIILNYSYSGKRICHFTAGRLELMKLKPLLLPTLQSLFSHVFPSCCRASLQSTTRTMTSKRTTTQTSSRRPAQSFVNCSGCLTRRSWSTITPAATGKERCLGRDGSTSASTTSASTPTYWEKKVGNLSDSEDTWCWCWFLLVFLSYLRGFGTIIIQGKDPSAVLLIRPEPP